MKTTFEIKEDFILNGNAFKIISGSIHYFRVVPEYWRDRLEKLKNLGCNTVETYIPWNLHEPKKGTFNFSGMADVSGFVKIAGELGLHVILRPSPYICAEWEFGGLPAWLLKDPCMKLRTCYEPFLKHVRDYYQELFKIIRPLLCTNGGPVIMLQVENEYGAYGHDEKYLEALKAMMEEFGADVPFVTSDGPWDDYLSCGSMKNVLSTANFGSKGHTQFKILRAFHKEKKPLMCMEFWVGWFDAWGDKKHNTGDLAEHVKDLDEILSEGSVNIYMVHGGTNFGFMNGSNYYDELTPDVTSYDYDALIAEDGSLTPKYHAFKEVISKYNPVRELPLSTDIRKKSFGKLKLTAKTGLFGSLEEISEGVTSQFTKSMEELDCEYGYMLYRAVLEKEHDIKELQLHGANDRAKVYLDRKLICTLYDRQLCKPVKRPKNRLNGTTLDILTENMGRVNYGAKMERQHKGIRQGVALNGHMHTGWEIYKLPLNNIEKLSFTKEYLKGRPAFYKFEFENNTVETSTYYDTFIDLSGFGKGCVFINGYNLGRFWEKGPQKRLYLPGPLIRQGKNTIIVFETEGKAAEEITLCDEPALE